MSQILHIFKKDARQFRLEILLSLAVLATLGCVAPFGWRSEFASLGGKDASLNVLALFRFLPLLVIATWGLLIARIVQADRLVGDTQFWITRPYDWKRLLAAKFLFLAAFIYLPLLIVQWELILRAGFHPTAQVAALAYNLLLITIDVVLPVFAIASVTANLGRVVLVLLALIASYVGFAALAYVLRSLNGMVLPPNPILPVLCLCACGLAIALQYATRKTKLARSILICAAVCFVLFQEFSSSVVARMYAQKGQGEQSAVKFAYAPRASEGYPASKSLNQIVFGIPLSVADGSAESTAAIEGVRIAIEAPDGATWVSQWASGPRFPFKQNGSVSVWMPPVIYEKFSHAPVTLHLTLAVASMREQTSVSIALPQSGVYVSVSDRAICEAKNNVSSNAKFTYQAVTGICRYPLEAPVLTGITFPSTSPACQSGAQGFANSFWSESRGSFVIDPILVGASIGNGRSYEAAKPDSCPISSMVFAQYKVAQRMQTGLTIQNFQLPAMTSASGQAPSQQPNGSQL